MCVVNTSKTGSWKKRLMKRYYNPNERKCNRLRKLSLTLDDRAEKIQVAVWPAVFYGALGTSIGQKHFTTLRRAPATVLVGDHKHASSFVAMHYLSTRVQDPLLYVVNDMLASLRRFFLYYPCLAEQMVASIRAFTGKSADPRVLWPLTFVYSAGI